MIYKNRKITELQSETIKWLRFPLIIGIVFIHNNTILNQNISYPQWVITIISLFGNVLPRICVPLFFIISGYLFFLNLDYSYKGYLHKIHRRFYTLLIPYFLWNSIAFLLLILFAQISITEIIVNPLKFVFTVFFDYRGGMPANFPMWFIRDLIILILFTPIIKIILHYTHGLILLLLLLLWMINIDFMNIFPRCSSVLFFMTGAFLSIRHINLLTPSFYIGRILIILYPILAIIDSITKESIYNNYYHKIGIILGVLITLYITPLMIKKKKFRIMFKMEDMSFFIFSSHALFIYKFTTLIHKTISPQNPFLLMFLYFIIPILTIIICCFCCKILRKATPTLSAILEGNFYKNSITIKKEKNESI